MRWLILLLLLTTVVHAADWVRAPISSTWDRKAVDLCTANTDCLVWPYGNESKRNAEDYYETTDPDEGPYCIQDGQYIKDYLCQSSNWTSRTKVIAEYMLGGSVPPKRITCAPYDEVLLPNYTEQRLVRDYFDEITTHGARNEPVMNNVCVLRSEFDGTSQLGFSLNVAPDDEQSPIHAFDVSCPATTSGWEECGQVSGQTLYYNSEINSVIIAPQQPQTPDWEPAKRIFNKTREYVMSEWHNAQTSDYSMYNYTGLFQRLYYAISYDKEIIGYAEQGVGMTNVTYLAVGMQNVDIGTSPCITYIKGYQARQQEQMQPTRFPHPVKCTPEEDYETGNWFAIAAKYYGNQAKVYLDTWHALTSKLRP